MEGRGWGGGAHAGHPEGPAPVRGGGTVTGSGHLLRAGATVGACTAAGRGLGYARTVVVAAVLGAGPLADAFFVAFRAAGCVRALFAGRGVGAAFIPMFTRSLCGGGAAPARVLAGEAVWFAGAALAVLTGVVGLAAPWLVQALAPGFGGEAQRLGPAAWLLRIMLPFVLFASLAQLLGGMLNGMGRFAAAAALPGLFNAVAVAALLGLGERLETPAHALAWGIAGGGAAQLGLVWCACWRAGMLPAFRWPRPTRRVRVLLRRAAPAVAGVAAAQGVMLVDLALASLLPAGTVSWLHYAERVARVLPAVAGGAAATVLLPHLARMSRVRGVGAAGGAEAANRTIEAVLLLGLPGAVGLALVAEPLVGALFERGAFDAGAAAATAAALAAYAGALPAWMLVRTLDAACFARADTVTPMAAGVGAVALNAGLSLALMTVWGHVGIALGTALAVWAQALALLAVLARCGGLAPDARLRRKVPAIVVASLAMAAVLWGLRLALGEVPGGGELPRAVSLGVLVAGGLAGFVLAARLTGAARLGDLARAWRSGGLTRRGSTASRGASVPAPRGVSTPAPRHPGGDGMRGSGADPARRSDDDRS